MINFRKKLGDVAFGEIKETVKLLAKQAKAKTVFLIDRAGQMIAASGDVDTVDATSLASLCAGKIAATGSIANLLREQEFITQSHEGESAKIHIQLVANRAILVVLFDDTSSSGLVRMRAKKVSEALLAIFERLDAERRTDSPVASGQPAELSDEDLEKLFES